MSVVYVAFIGSYDGTFVVGIYTDPQVAWDAAETALASPAFSDDWGPSTPYSFVEPHHIDAAPICEWREEHTPIRHMEPPPWTSQS